MWRRECVERESGERECGKSGERERERVVRESGERERKCGERESVCRGGVVGRERGSVGKLREGESMVKER